MCKDKFHHPIAGQQVVPPVSTEVPDCDFLTDYDRQHLSTYLRLIDAAAAGAAPDEMCRLILNIDPDSDAEWARRILTDHLRRAQWMVATGYRELAGTTSETRDTGQTSDRDRIR